MNHEILKDEILKDELLQQLMYAEFNSRQKIDIIIIVHDQLDYIQRCIESIYKNTKDFNLFIWDNGSAEPTANYLREIATKNNVYLERSEENLGFIKPNNILAAKGSSPYLILLNSDTEVYSGWDTAMVGWLIGKPDYAQVGYLGGMLDETGLGGTADKGECIDYVCGWCVCMPRNIYNKFGLFDEKNLNFAYGEDADLSLRLVEAGYKIRALHLEFIVHFGNATIRQVRRERDCKTTFEQNHDYIRQRWKDYLSTKRALLTMTSTKTYRQFI